jgi:hypothetical protein
VVFGPKPRDFTKKISRATRQLALRKALSERLKAGDVLVVDDFKLTSPKTKEFAGVLAALQLQGTTLVVSHGLDKNLQLASRNLPGVELATGDSLNTYQVLRSDKLVFTRGAFENIEQRLSKEYNELFLNYQDRSPDGKRHPAIRETQSIHRGGRSPRQQNGNSSRRPGAFQGQGAASQHSERSRQSPPQTHPRCRSRPQLEKGHRHAESRR